MEPKQSPETEPTTYPFAAEERARLSRCKAAVEAGLYSDARAEPSRFDSILTMHELRRLASYRAAVKAGFYTDYFAPRGEAAPKSRARRPSRAPTHQHPSASAGRHASG